MLTKNKGFCNRDLLVIVIPFNVKAFGNLLPYVIKLTTDLLPSEVSLTFVEIFENGFDNIVF